MYKQVVTYEDYDDVQQIETLYFNVTQIELTANLDLKDEAEALQQELLGEPRDLTQDELRRLLELIKKIVKLGYGVRESSKKFVKNEEVWNDFESSPAYDAFIISLFEDPSRAAAFMTGVLPRSLREAAQAEMNQLELPQFKSNEDVPVTPEKKLPTRAELEAMSKEELAEAMQDMTSEDYARIMGWR